MRGARSSTQEEVRWVGAVEETKNDESGNSQNHFLVRLNSLVAERFLGWRREKSW